MGDASKLVAAVLTLAFAVPSAHAEDGSIEASVFFGGDLIGGNNELGNSFYDDQVPSMAPLLGLRASYSFLGRFGVELEGKLAPSSTDGESGRPSIATTVLGYRVHGMMLHGLTDVIDVFGVVGFGAETAIFDDPPSALAIDTPDTDTAVHWGAGVKYSFGEGNYGARLDLRQLITAGRDPSVALSHEVHLGAFFRFGAGKTETVVVEKIVERPVDTTQPAPKPVDSDHDGIADNEDKCPHEAEVVNSIDDDDGCPEIDSDNDGLLGSRDKCPDAAEDPDGFEDDDGCPDLDNDGDGRADRIDACPMEAETLNGFEDDDGCPDEVPQAVQEFTGVIKGIRFKRGSARILRASHRTLDKAVKLFEQYPSLRIEVSGHTDNRGSMNTNMTLSRKRADYVKWYLVDKGVDADRIITVGLGPERPLGSNKTRKGRARNRRIEFRLLPGPATIEDGSAPKAKGESAPAPEPTAP